MRLLVKATLKVVILAALVLLARADARGATLSVVAERDTSIYQAPPNSSAGGAAGIFVGSNGMGSPRRGLIAFDIASVVPVGSTITSASLSMVHGAGSGGESVDVSLHRLTADWGEGVAGNGSPTIAGGGSGFAAAEGDATWSARFHSSTAPVPWSSPEGAGDFVPQASGSATVGRALDTLYTWTSNDFLVSDVQNWLDSPASNFGWLLMSGAEGTASSVRVFYSSEAGVNGAGMPLDQGWKPTLTVTFVPEPSGALLWIAATALGSAFWRGKRERGRQL